MVEHSPKSWQARKKNHHGSIRTAPKRFTVVFENTPATYFVYTTMVPGQPAGLSKEEYLYASADWLSSFLSQRLATGQL